MPDEFDIEAGKRVANRFPMPGLDEILVDDLKKGMVITSPSEIKEDEFVHYDIKNVRELFKEINELYQKPNVTRKDFVEALRKHRERSQDETQDFIERLENFKQDKAFEIVEKKQNKKGEVVIKMKEIPQEDKKKYVDSITKKLLKKVTSEQLEKMFHQAIMKLNDVSTLKKVDKALKKKKPEVKEYQGCFFLKIDGVDLFMVN